MHSRVVRILLILTALDVRLTRAQTAPTTSPLRCVARGAATIDPTSLRTSTGNGMLDSYIGTESARLIELFGLAPNLYYVDAPEWDNAAASSDPHDGFTTGTVYVGLELLRAEFPDPLRGRYAVVGVLAHEFGHILQYKFEGATFSDPFETEIQADFLAGYFIARRSLVAAADVDKFAFSLFLRGDPPHFFEAPEHGNGDQRVAAMLAGYYARNLPPNEAYNLGRTVAHDLSTIFDNTTSYELLADSNTDPQAAAQLQVTATEGWNNSARNPYVRFWASFQNRSNASMIVKLVADVEITPTSDSNQVPRPLTRRIVQRTIRPGQSEIVDLTIRSTAQSDVVLARLVPRWTVAFEQNVMSPKSPTDAPNTALADQLADTIYLLSATSYFGKGLQHPQTLPLPKQI